jgi:rubrerythrin
MVKGEVDVMAEKTPLELARELIAADADGKRRPGHHDIHRIAKALIERDTPVEVFVSHSWTCPKCGDTAGMADTPNFCSNCGVPLGWI